MKPCHQRMSTLEILPLMGKLFPSTHSTFTPHVVVTIVLLNLRAWTYSSKPPAASTKLTGRCGDVLLVAMSDHLISHYLSRRWHTNLATTDHVHYRTPVPWIGDYAHSWTIRFSLVHVFCWARPTWSRARHVITTDDLVDTRRKNRKLIQPLKTISCFDTSTGCFSSFIIINILKIKDLVMYCLNLFI